MNDNNLSGLKNHIWWRCWWFFSIGDAPALTAEQESLMLINGVIGE